MKTLILFLMSLATVANAAKKQPLPTKAKTFSISSIEGEAEDNGNSIVTITLNKKPSWENLKIEDHGTFLQVELPDTIVPNPGEFYEGNSPTVLKIAAFQVKPTTAGIRLFVNEDALYVKQSTKVDILDANIVLTLDRTKLLGLIEKDPKKVAMQPDKVKEVVESSATEADSQAPATKLAEIDAIAPSETNLQEKMVYAAIYCLILLMGLGAFYWLKPRLRHRSQEDVTAVAMSTLSTHALSAKQKLQVIQVGGQQVLLGVTPNNIQFLTTIDRAESVRSQARKQITQPAQRPVQAKQRKRPPELPMKRPSTQAKKPKPRMKAQPEGNHEAISDVTKLIREKLRNLPSV